MRLPYQPSSLLGGEVDECVVIDVSNEEKKPAASLGRRLVQAPNKKKNKKSSSPSGETELRELMRLCEYEVDQDPYRGLGFLDKVNDDKVVTPWDICQWGILSMPKSSGDGNNNEGNVKTGELLDSTNAESLVRNLTESCCPSILAWTKEHLENKKKQQSKKQRTSNGKKRNRSGGEQDTFPCLGNRPSDTKYRCPCDSNPFCLGSMGGIMDELLKERCQKGITISIIEDDENGENDKDKKKAKVFGFGSNFLNKKKKDAEVEIVDVDENMKTGEETGSEENVFAFMGNNEKSSSASEKTKNTDSVKSTSEASVKTTATCKPLGPNWTKPEEGEPSEVYSSKNCMSSQPFDEEGYSPTTKEEVAKLRRSEIVDISKLKTFIRNLFELCESPHGMTMEEYIRTMTEWHKSLIFTNPIIEESDSSSDEVRIALPPGIQNLGATCYLNTQLQCLAQIPVFLDGIFSWRPVNATHKMNGVMTKLQKLLAQMLVGGNAKYTSLDFSNALGIQHNEQQDPNEFARLLFDRMEESFQQCSNASASPNDSKKGNGLGKLLQRIFHGTTTYETICMKCGKTSVRSEGFMDLNLPIVHRVDEESDTDDTDLDSSKDGSDPAFVKRKRRKKGILEKAFEKQKKKNPEDTDVQYCFDQYTKTEYLTGDNQYFCDDCNSKQDAKRVMSLTELPPVLNIQLSRYVFDRQKFVKKKLTDKVRLPTILTVDKHDSCSSSTSSKRKRKSNKKYILCAVMRHRGTSAYSGHYIAEAMDWTIGQWYEFNDEIVKVLPTPSNSYVPNDYLDLKDGDIQTKSAGSEDAYNMYYVDEEYMAENSITTMSRNQRLNSIQNAGSTTTESADTDVLSTLIRENSQCYSVLTELCYVDYAISERLRRRKDAIRKHMFVDPSSMLLQEGQPKEDKEPYFWVDGKTLRQFLACDRSLDDKLNSGETLVCPKTLLCSHGCLHPRTARRGKLLRQSIYDSYVSLLSGERKYLSATSGVKESDVIGCKITFGAGMTCEVCSKSYRNELNEKLEFLRNVYDVYVDILDETNDSMNSFKKNSTEEAVEEEYGFIVARSTITKFKRLVVDLMKSVADFAKGGSLDNTSTQSDPKNNFVFDGIDNLVISTFPGSPTCSPCGTEKKMGTTGTDDPIDEKFNSKITCSHGNCNDFSLRIVRYVSSKTWVKIKKIFPDAIEHKVLFYEVDGKVRKPNVEDDGCALCRTEKDAITNLTSDVERWAKETKGNDALKQLLDGKKISLSEIAFHNFDNAQNNCRLVHRDDITNLCKSVRLLGRVSKLKISEHSDLKTHVENLAFPSYHSVVLDFEKQPNARLLQSIRSLTCCEHHRVIKSAIIDRADGEVEHRHRLSNNIAVLSSEEYSAYINALAELLIILNCDYHKQEGTEKDLQDDSDFSTLKEVKNFAVSCHPSITMAVGEEVSSDEILLFSLDGNSKEFSIVPGFCNHETCKKDFVPIVQKQVGVPVDSVSVDSIDARDQKKGGRKRSDSRIGSVMMSPIIVESDLEDNEETADKREKLRVFECKADSELTDAMQSLKTVTGTPNGDNDAGLGFGVRRSTRRRKVKFPVGCITSEDIINIGLHHNVAALRLLLFQDCRIPLGCKLSIAISKGDETQPKGLEIAFDGSTKTLIELIDHLKTTEDGFSDLDMSNPFEKCFLLYKVDEDDKCKDIEATLMDSLLEASNIASPDSKGNAAKGRKIKKRSLERGFQGSLLQSSTNSGIVDDELVSRDSDGAAPCPIEESKEVNKTRVRSNTIISDDEAPAETKKNIPSDTSDDDEVAILPSFPVAPRKKIGDDQQMKIVCKLMELTDSKDESRCFEAVSWVMKMDPKYSEEEVIDAALTRLFDVESNVAK